MIHTNLFENIYFNIYLVCIIKSCIFELSKAMKTNLILADMKYRIIGITDSVNECDCCGKTDLKRTYVMADEMDNELYFGLVCGAKANGQSTTELKESVKVVKLENELGQMVIGATTQYKQNQVLKFISKKKIDLNSFLKQHGRVLETINDFIVYGYGSRTFNIK